MQKKNILGLGILLVFLILIISIGYNIYINMKVEEDSGKITDTIDISYGDLNLQYEYLGENLWRYQVTGTVPDPCHTVSTVAIVRESYPEQVTIQTTVNKPDLDTVCIQIIQEVYQEGEFEASPEAEVTFEIE